MPDRVETKLTPKPPDRVEIKLTPPEAKEPCGCGSPTKGAAPRAATCTVIVEDGSIVDGANSYISVADADAYLACQRYNTEWLSATPDQQVQAVVTATRAIDANMVFNGYVVSTDQSLRWPRIYCPNPDVYAGYPYSGYPTGLGIGYGYFPMDQIPKCLREATAQEALELLRLDRLSDAATQGILGIQSMRVDVIDITYRSGGSASQMAGAFVPLSDQVGAMLAPLGNVAFSDWGTSMVERVM
jgi:hypothetical protein